MSDDPIEEVEPDVQVFTIFENGVEIFKVRAASAKEAF